MSLFAEGLLLIAILFLVLSTGLWVGATLLIVGFVGLWLSGVPAGSVMVTQIWGSATAWALTPLPLFIWMGEVMLRADLASDLFRGLAPFFRRLPGRLVHVNIAAAALFAAVCGSSTATTAILGRMSLDELVKQGYGKGAVLSSIAASGTLGILIPPSIVMIVYGTQADVSIIQLFMAGIIPGIALAVLFAAFVGADAILRPDRYGAAGVAIDAANTAASEEVSLRSLLGVLPIVLMIVGMIGSIYAGLATATEAGAVGVVLAFALAASRGRLTTSMLIDSVTSSVRTNSMIVFILACAGTLNMAMGFSGLPDHLAEIVSGMDLSSYMLIVVLSAGLLVLGCFLDGLSVVVLTSAIVLPMVQAVGIDLVWFGVYLVIMIEIALITPPVGFNLFVLSGISGMSIFRIAASTTPYVLIMMAFVAIITLFPDLVLYLPRSLMH